jgi:hypothetical protein
MLIILLNALIASLIATTVNSNQIRTSEIDPFNIKLTTEDTSRVKARILNKKRKAKHKPIIEIILNKKDKRYFNKLTNEDKRVFTKIALAKGFSGRSLDDLYLEMYKEDGLFKMESFSVLPIKMKKALPVIREYKQYNYWALKDINIKRGGESGSYFVDIEELKYIPRGKYFHVKIKLNVVFTGFFKLDLLVFDHLTDPKIKDVPFVKLKLRKQSKLAKEIIGRFRFYELPGKDYMIVHFKGFTKVHWAIYQFLPIALLKSQVGERVQTVLENVSYKVDTLLYPKTLNTNP